MSYDFYGNDPQPSSPGERLVQDIDALGLRPEIFTDLSVEDTRIIFGGFAKLLTTITHPDRGVHKSVLGLEVEEINAVAGRFRSLDDDSLSDSLGELPISSASVAEYNENQTMRKNAERVENRNLELATKLLDAEGPLSNYSGRIVIGIYLDNPKSVFPDNALLEMVFAEGAVSKSTILRSEPKLASSMNKEAQKYINLMRPDLDGDSKMVLIDEHIAKKTGLPVGSWYHLLSAKGVKDETQKRSAVLIYDPANPDASDEIVFIGATLFGNYSYSPNQIEQAQDTWPPLELVQKTHNKIDMPGVGVSVSYSQTAQLLGQGFINPLQDESEITKADYLVLKGGPRHPNVCYIIPGAMKSV